MPSAGGEHEMECDLFTDTYEAPVPGFEDAAAEADLNTPTHDL